MEALTLNKKNLPVDLLTMFYQLTERPIFLLSSNMKVVTKSIPTNTVPPSQKYLKELSTASNPDAMYQLFVIQQSDLIGLLKFENKYLLIWSRPLPIYITQKANLTLNESDKFIPKMLAIIKQMEFDLTGNLISDSDIQVVSLNLNDNVLLDSGELNDFHNNNNLEAKMSDAITRGNKEDFEKGFDAFLNSGEPGLLDKDSSIRNQKNLVIVATTIFTRSALKSKLQPEIAYRMSDRYIQEVESLRKIDDLREYILNIGLDFIKKIQMTNMVNTLPIITKVQDYILKNIHKQLTINEIALYVGISKSYLMKIFKMYQHMTIDSYIAQQRIKEAQGLLTYSSEPIADISDHLGYNSQAYFSRCFSKATGISPSKYRTKYQNGFI